MHPSFLRILGVALLGASACTIELQSVDDRLIGCSDDADCPTGYSCNPETGHCVNDTVAELDSNPSLELPAGQTAIKNGDLLTITGTGEPGSDVHSAHLVNVTTGGVAQPVTGVVIDPEGNITGSFTAEGLAHDTTVAFELILEGKGRRSVAENSRTLPVDVDNEAPANPSVTIDEGGLAADITIHLTLAAVGADEMLVDGDLVDAAEVRTWISFDTALTVELEQGNGPKVVSVQFRDSAHNRASASTAVTLDTTYPVCAPVIESPWPIDKIKNGDIITVTGNVTTDTTVVTAEILCLDTNDGELAQTAIPGQVERIGGALSGSVDIGAPCASTGGLGVQIAVRVVVENAAGVRSIATDSVSNSLALDNEAPTPASVDLVPFTDALADFVPTTDVTLVLDATEPDGSPVEMLIVGDVQPGLRVGDWVAFPGTQAVPGQEPIALSVGDDLKTVTVTFRDAAHNQSPAATLNLTLDTVLPPAPVQNKLRLVEACPQPNDPSYVDESQNTFTLAGEVGAIVAATRAAVYDDAELTQPLASLGAAGDGTIAGSLIPNVEANDVFVVSMDSAGNQSAQSTSVTVPAFLSIEVSPNPARAGAQPGGGPLEIEFISSMVLAANPVVTVHGAQATLFSSAGTYVYHFTPAGTEPEGHDQVVVRITGENGTGASAPGTMGTSAITSTLDFTAPVLVGGAVTVTEYDPGIPDQVEGAAAAASDAVSAPERLLVTLYDATGTTVVDSEQARTDGSFGPLDARDNENATLLLTLTDEAGNESAPIAFDNDIDVPVITSLVVSPSAQSHGGTVDATFEVTDDAHDLAALPTVVIGGRAATWISGTTNTSDGSSHAFAYQLTLDQTIDSAGLRVVDVDATDTRGNHADVETSLIVDYTPPWAQNTTPGDRPAWNGEPAIYGTSSDDLSGPALVEVSIRDLTTGTWWDGAAFAASSEVWLVAAGTTSWAFDVAGVAFVADDSYTLRQRATDAAGNTETPTTGTTFLFDVTANAPPDNLIAASVFDGRVRVSWDLPSSGAPDHYLLYFDDEAGDHPPFGGAGADQGDSPITVPGGDSTFDVTGLPVGHYVFAITAVDGASNESAYSNTDIAASRWWRLRHPALTSNSPDAVVTPAPGVFIAAGAAGTIWRTSDHGTTWAAIESGVVDNLTDIVWTGTVLVAVGSNGTITRSIDGGDTWVAATSNTTASFNSVWGEDELLLAAGGSGTVCRSVNAGATWTVVQGTGATLEDIWASGTHVVAASGMTGFPYRGYVYVSHDTGDTWSVFSFPETYARIHSVWGNGLEFVAVGERQKIYYTADAGDSWVLAHSASSGQDSWHVTGEGTNLIAVGDAGDGVRSTDGGVTWAQVYNGPNRRLRHVWLDGTDGLIVGSNGTLARTINGGATWTTVVSGTANHFYGVVGRGGTAVAVGGTQTFGTSTDFGATWTYAETTPSDDFNAMIVNGTTLIGVGGRINSHGIIYRSTDEGETWNKVYTTPGNLLDIWSDGADLFVAVGQDLDGYHSTDGGITWSDVFIGVLSDPYGRWVWGSDTAIVATDRIGMMRSVDEGLTWTEVANPAFFGCDLRNVWGSGDVFLTVCGPDVLRSDDAGLTWTVITPDGNTEELDTIGGEGDDVLAVGGNGTVVFSRDLGLTWTLVPDTGTTDWMRGVWVNNGHFLTAGGVASAENRGTLIASIDGGVTWTTSVVGTSYFNSVSGSGLDRYAVGSYSAVAHSSDGGLTWSEATHFTPAASSGTLTAVHALGPGRAVALGSAGTAMLFGPP